MTFPQALVFVLKENTLSHGRNLLERQNMYDTNDLNGKYPTSDERGDYITEGMARAKNPLSLVEARRHSST